MAQISFDFGDSDARKSGYKIGQRDIESVKVKGASDAIAREANANIRLLADRLQRGEIGAAEWHEAMRREVKLLHMAQASLARGGIERMRAADWERVGELVRRQFKGVEGKYAGLRAFADDIAAERYGKAGELSSGVLNRAGMYADAGRGTYENERVALAKENGRTRAMRVAAAADHCDVCAAENGVERDIEDVVAIGDSPCGSRCFCVIVTRQSEASPRLRDATNATPSSPTPISREQLVKEVASLAREVAPKMPTPSFLAEDPIRLKPRAEIVANARISPAGFIEVADDLGADDVVRMESLLREVIHSHTTGYTRAAVSEKRARNMEEGLNELLGRMMREDVHKGAGYNFTIEDYAGRDNAGGEGHPFDRFVGAWEDIRRKLDVSDEESLEFYKGALKIPIDQRVTWLKEQLGVQDFARIIGRFG